MRMRKIVWVLPLGALCGGCVSSGTYDAERLRSAGTRVALEQAQAEGNRLLAKRRQKVLRLQRQVRELQRGLKTKEANLASQSHRRRRLANELSSAQAENRRFRTELHRLGKDVDALLGQKGVLRQELLASKRKLARLEAAQRAFERRQRALKQMVARFQRLISAGNLKVGLRKGRLVLQLPSGFLFDSGRATLKPEGRKALGAIAKGLSDLPGRQFQVSGHSDSRPIRTARYPSNWELSTARGVAVVKGLIKAGVPAKRLSAAGYGSTDPIAPNDTAESRAKNRRIEISLQPDLSELLGDEGLGG